MNYVISFFMACFVLLYSGMAVVSESEAGDKTLVISAIINEQTHAIAKYVLKEAYIRIGYAVRFDDLPGQRALEWANNGITDGDVARIEGTEKKFPNLIPVETPVIYFKGVAFAKDFSGRIASWEDLKGIRIGIVRGIRYSEIGTKDMEPVMANDMTHLFTILDKGRIEVAVAVLDAGRIEIQKNFMESGIHPIGSPLFSAPLYHFLHAKNKDLIAPLNEVLNKMMQSGEIETIWANAFKEITRR